MIQEAYCSYEVSKLLKEKGFDEACHAMYNRNGYLIPINFPRVTKSEKREFVLDAPTHQMAMAWIREMHRIAINIEWIKNSEDQYQWRCIVLTMNNGNIWYETKYHSYEEAVEAALKYCLQNLSYYD